MSFHTPPTPAIYPLSLHDALPIYRYARWRRSAGSKAGSRMESIRRNMRGPTGSAGMVAGGGGRRGAAGVAIRAEVGSRTGSRSEEHTSELQSRFDLVCRLLLEKKK